MRFSRQLLIGHAALLFVTIVTGTMATIALQVTSARLEHVTREVSTDVIDIYRLRFQAEQVIATSRGFLLTGEADAWNRFEIAVDRLQGNLDAFHGQRAVRQEVTDVEEAARAYVAAAQTVATRRTATADPKEILPLLETALAPARDRFEHAIATMLNDEKASFDDTARRARGFAGRTKHFVVMATALGIGLSIALAWLSIRRLQVSYERERAAAASAKRSSDARDELLAIVSHDLRSPLSAVEMGARLLDDEVADPQARKHIAVVQNAAERMQHLIEQLLDTAAIEAGRLELHTEPCDVNQLLRTVHELFSSQAREASVRLSVDVENGLVAMVDREKVIQVLSNLVGNALKFTGPGGMICLAASGLRNAVYFEVTDTGKGIAEQQMPHIFERHWQGRLRSRGSLGLGLYISKHVVEAHGGRIGVQTAIGRGTTFWFQLPAMPTASGEASSVASLPSAASGEPHKDPRRWTPHDT